MIADIERPEICVKSDWFLKQNYDVKKDNISFKSDFNYYHVHVARSGLIIRTVLNNEEFKEFKLRAKKVDVDKVMSANESEE